MLLQVEIMLLREGIIQLEQVVILQYQEAIIRLDDYLMQLLIQEVQAYVQMALQDPILG